MIHQKVTVFRVFGTVASLACLALSTTLVAQTSGQAVYGGSPSAVALSLSVRARVSAACGFSPGAPPGGNYAVGDVEQPYSLDIGFMLRCNGPMRVAVESANGGLLAQDVASAPSGYSRIAVYQVTLALAGNAGVSPVQGDCPSTALVTGTSGCLLRGPATGTQGLLLAGPSSDVAGSFLRVSSPGNVGPATLMASNNYSDRLTVTISPAA